MSIPTPKIQLNFTQRNDKQRPYPTLEKIERMIRIIFGVFAILYSINLYSQENSSGASTKHTVSFKTQYIKIKDKFNYGLVFSGPNLIVGYSFSKITDKDVLLCSPEIAFGGVFNKGAGFAWRFKPIDIFYGRNISTELMAIGGYVATDYQWQQYSELQGGRLFWFSTIEIGPRMEFEFPYKSWVLTFDISNSLAGFTSRPEPSTETYYYEFSFSEFISVANQDLSFGLFDLFNRTKFGMTIQRDSWKRLTLGYCFEYFGYYKGPTLSFINHSLSINWKI